MLVLFFEKKNVIGMLLNKYSKNNLKLANTEINKDYTYIYPKNSLF